MSEDRRLYSERLNRICIKGPNHFTERPGKHACCEETRKVAVKSNSRESRYTVKAFHFGLLSTLFLVGSAARIGTFVVPSEPYPLTPTTPVGAPPPAGGGRRGSIFMGRKRFVMNLEDI